MKRTANNEKEFLELVERGVFEIDTEGRIWRLGRFHFSGNGKIVMMPRRRAENRKADGYLRVTARVKNLQLFCSAHRLVWSFFFGLIPGGMEINHRDGNPTNNHPDNLELVTPSENVLHAYRALRRNDRKGENNTFAKIKTEEVYKIRERRNSGERLITIAHDYNVSISAIWNITSGRTWNHVCGQPAVL